MTEPPIVLVPGFLGNDTHWRISRLRRRHPHLRWLATQPGPFSSHHDRACEVFYALKGGRVDYGEAHSRRCGHGRFGRKHHEGLYPEWDEDHPIDMVGHSIGGVTLRVLQHLLSEGHFPGHATSAAWVRSITALASPLNGDPVVYGLGIPAADAAIAGQSGHGGSSSSSSPCCADAVVASNGRPALSPAPSQCSLCGSSSESECSPLPYRPDNASTPLPHAGAPPPPVRIKLFSAGWLLTQCIHILSWLDYKPLNKLVDMRLDHWHLSRRDGSFLTSLRTLVRALAWRDSLGQGTDNAAYEVQPFATKRINDSTSLHDCTAYVSFASSRAPLHGMYKSVLKREKPGSIVPRITAVAREMAVYSFTCFVRVGGASSRAAACEALGYEPAEWVAHDGILSVRGQKAPIGEPCVRLSILPPTKEEEGISMEDDPMPPRTPSTSEVVARSSGGVDLNVAVPEEEAEEPCGGKQAAGTAKPLLPLGVWHVHELDMDHFAVCGVNMMSSTTCCDEFWDHYVKVRAEGFPRRARR